jgi:hypothetical protein
MHPRDRAIANAQREANLGRRTMLVIKLNPYSPLYVVRYASARLSSSDDVVAVVEPSVAA